MLSIGSVPSKSLARWLGRAAEERADPFRALAAEFARTLSAGEHDLYLLYLVSHGAVTFWLVFGLLRQEFWAYPATLPALSAFFAFQLHRYAHTRDIGLIALTILDLIVIGPTWNE